MSCFCCPVCRQPLHAEEHSLVCPKGHRFDKARSGYVNLLCSQQSHNRRHGDDKRMLLARRAFLGKGHYAPLRDAVLRTLQPLLSENSVLLDAGCGEGYYTAYLAQELNRIGFAGSANVKVCAVDISKDALAMFGAQSPVERAVAGLFALPLRDAGCDAVLSVFAPCAEKEFARVLRPHGALVRVVPTVDHLFGLKAAVYPGPRENPPTREVLNGFTLAGRETLTYPLHLTDRDDIRALFQMTPYYYKTSAGDQQRLLTLDALDTTIGFTILRYQKD